MTYYRLSVQPSVKYVAGYGISRPGYPLEWTPCSREPTAEQWEAWRQKCMRGTKRRHPKARGAELERLIDGTWAWAINEEVAAR